MRCVSRSSWASRGSRSSPRVDECVSRGAYRPRKASRLGITGVSPVSDQGRPPDIASSWDETLGGPCTTPYRGGVTGGPERLEKRKAPGRLDARGAWHTCSIPARSTSSARSSAARSPADAIVAGSGTIDGRPVMVGAEDFTVLGRHHRRRQQRQALPHRRARAPRARAARHAARGRGLPADGRGHGRAPTDLLVQAQCSGRVPIVTGVLGPSAGHGALIAPMSDFA